MPKGSFLLSFFYLCSICVLSFAHEAPNGLRHKQIGEYVLYANPHATMPDSAYSGPYWPIVADWGPETYVYGGMQSFYHPRIAPSDSLLHVFASSNRWVPFHFTSGDSGDTWQLFAIYGDTSNPEDCGGINVFSQENRLFTVWYGTENPNGEILFRSSFDYGETWPIVAQLGYPWPGSGPRYGNVSGHDDTAFVSFDQDGDVHILTCWRSTDRGQSWTDPGVIAHQDASYPPSLSYGSGTVSIAYNAGFGTAVDVYYVRSLDHGTTWSVPVLLGFPDSLHGQWPQLAADSLGNVAVCWTDYLGSPYWWTGSIWCRVSHDSGQTWNEAARLDSDYRGEGGTSVSVEGGFVSVAWVGLGDLHYRESWDGGIVWRSEEIVSVGGSGACWDPRLARQRDTMHMVWSKIEWVDPDHDVQFIKYNRKDDLSSIRFGSEESPKPKIISIMSSPNPFNSQVLLVIKGWKGGDAEISIYDLLGKPTRVLRTIRGTATWDATDNAGRKVSSGIYFARVETPQGGAIAKLLYLK